MPEREYFSYRHAIPGYTFILLLVAINLFPLFELLGKAGVSEVFGAFLAFLSLFTGSALGFLLSQIYWWLFKKKGGFFGIDGTKPILNLLTKTCKDYNLKIREAKKNELLEAISDYIETQVDQEKTFEYSARRWDMYHVLGSTLWSLGLGFAVGLGFRVYFHVFLFKASFSFEPINRFLAELVLLSVLLGFASFLFWIIWKKGRRKLESEYCLIMTAFTKSKLLRIEKNSELKEEFKQVLNVLLNGSEVNAQ